MNKFSLTASIIASLFIGCGGSASSGSLSTEIGNDAVSHNIELMDLRSSVIILQSEIIGLKESLKLATDINDRLNTQIEEKNARLKAIEGYPSSSKASVTKKNDSRAAVTKFDETDTVEKMYKTAISSYFDGEYKNAIEYFEKLISVDDSHDLSDNAQYWIGESYFALGHYEDAMGTFEIVLTYPQSNKNDYAQFKIGLCLLKLNKPNQANAAFQSFLDSYPKSELVSRVETLKIRMQ